MQFSVIQSGVEYMHHVSEVGGRKVGVTDSWQIYKSKSILMNDEYGGSLNILSDNGGEGRPNHMEPLVFHLKYINKSYILYYYQRHTPNMCVILVVATQLEHNFI